MSDIEEPEYEVESVVAAKVEAASWRSKRSKLIWKYLVRWKGYSPNDDTWEPIESFNGSEHLVEAFWNRCTTHGRDTSNMSLFKAGEEFRPVGPPRHKPRPKSTGNGSAHTLQSSEEPSNRAKLPNMDSTPINTRKRRRASPETIEISESDRSPKRPKENTTGPPQSSASSSKLPATRSTRSRDVVTPTSIPSTYRGPIRLRQPSPSEIVPESDEEPYDIRMPYTAPKYSAQQVTSSEPKAKTPQRQELSIVIGDDSPPKVAKANLPQLVEDETTRVPAHRARLANPRVKLVDDSETLSMEGLSRKARAARAAANAPSTALMQAFPTRTTRSRPGPGRSSTGLMQEKSVSSLLTGEKGALKTVKGRYAKPSMAPGVGHTEANAIDSMDVDADVEPPSAEELLRLAGLNPKAADALSDFEDGSDDPNPGNATKPAEHVEVKEEAQATPDKGDVQQQLRKESLDQAKHNLFPDPRPSVPATMNMNWGRSTIFGPLALGSNSETDQSTTSRLLLNLDTSMVIPTLVAEASQSVRTSLNMKADSKQVPGKFYGTEAALALLGTVRAAGRSAAIVIVDNATDEEKKNFELFLRRLEDGEIFVSMTGTQIVVFSSSSSTLLSSRLNTPATLLNQPGKVIASHVDVENPSGFADAATNADPRRWSQYLNTIEK